jgi:hypothetical protein
LGRLLDLGLVHKEIPFGESEKSSRRTIYRMADPFFRFWFRVVAPHRAALASAPHGSRLAVWHRLKDALVAETWETLCRSAVPGIAAFCEDTKPECSWMPGRRWWKGRDPEWDVVSATTDGREALAGEVKWSGTPLGDADIERLAGALMARPLPPELPPHTRRVLFVPTTTSSVAVTSRGVRVIDAAAVMKALM